MSTMGGSKARWAGAVLVGVSVGLLVTGCGGRTLTTSVQDQTLVPGPTTKAEETPAVSPPVPMEAAKAEVPREVEPPPASAPALEETQVRELPAPPPVSAPVAEEPALPSVAAVPEPQTVPAVEASLADVFFDFDQFTLRNEARSALEANAQVLKSQDGWRLLIEGHCDERGTADYNLVLGERRAQAVKRYLAELGVPTGQLQTTSYGKERPFCTEHSEACWQTNRRAHMRLQ